MTDAERALWRQLRLRSLGGHKFRRQFPLGRYIVDFVCLEAKLVIEVDGGQHNGSDSDRVRDAWLAGQGFKALRFWNNEVLGDIEAVMGVVYAALHPHPNPPPSRGRETSAGPLRGGAPSPSTGEGRDGGGE